MIIQHIYSVALASDQSPNVLEFKVRALFPDGEEDCSYIYHPDDPYGGEPHQALTEWMEMNPDFPIDPYEPPAEE